MGTVAPLMRVPATSLRRVDDSTTSSLKTDAYLSLMLCTQVRLRFNRYYPYRPRRFKARMPQTPFASASVSGGCEVNTPQHLASNIFINQTGRSIGGALHHLH